MSHVNPSLFKRPVTAFQDINDFSNKHKISLKESTGDVHRHSIQDETPRCNHTAPKLPTGKL